MSIRRNIYPMAFVPSEELTEELPVNFAEALDGKAISIGRKKTIFHRVGEDRLLSEPTGKAGEKKVYGIRFSVGTLPPDGKPLILFDGCKGEFLTDGHGQAMQPVSAGGLSDVWPTQPLTLTEKKELYEGAAKHLKTIAKKPEKILRIERGRNDYAGVRQEETLPLWELNEEQKKKMAKRLRICTDKEKIRFEVYALEETRPCAEEIAEAFRTVFQSTEDMTFDIQVRKLGRLANPLDPTGEAAISKRIREIERVVDLAQDLVGCIILLPEVSEDVENMGRGAGMCENGTATEGICAGANQHDIDLLVGTMRTGFALRNHLTYFLKPWETAGQQADQEQQGTQEQQATRNIRTTKNSQAAQPSQEPLHGTMTHRAEITAAMEDLLLQMGYIRELEEARWHVEDGMSRVPVAGVHLLKNLHSIHGKAELLPMCITVNFVSGRVFAECSAFGRGRLHYYESAFELARLSIDPEFERKCRECRINMFRQKLLIWAELYKKDPFLVILDADAQARGLYPGFSDEMLSDYEYQDACRPAQLEVGTPESPRTANFNGTGLRILRIRRGEEVPDSYGEVPDQEGYGPTTGLFKYGDTYWTIPPIHKNGQSSCGQPEHDLLEVYPVQVQKNDYPDKWVSHANLLRLLRDLPDNEGVMPLPFYLLGKIKRYVLQYDN